MNCKAEFHCRTDATKKQLRCQVGTGQLFDQAWFQSLISTGESSNTSLTIDSEVANQMQQMISLDQQDQTDQNLNEDQKMLSMKQKMALSLKLMKPENVS